MNCEIIGVGTELLLGDIVNSDAQYLARELASMGIVIHYQEVVGDNPERMRACISTAVSRSDLVILTGGLDCILHIECSTFHSIIFQDLE